MLSVQLHVVRRELHRGDRATYDLSALRLSQRWVHMRANAAPAGAMLEDFNAGRVTACALKLFRRQCLIISMLVIKKLRQLVAAGGWRGWW